MAILEPKRGRDKHHTADNYKIDIGDQVWHIDNINNPLIVEGFDDNWQQNGLVNVSGGIHYNLSLLFHKKLNALMYKRTIMSEKLLKSQREQGALASDLKVLDKEIQNEGN